jgi:hypothetical protein
MPRLLPKSKVPFFATALFFYSLFAFFRAGHQFLCFIIIGGVAGVTADDTIFKWLKKANPLEDQYAKVFFGIFMHAFN